MMAFLLTAIFPSVFTEGHAWLPSSLVAMAEAAARALLVASVVWSGLRVMGARNVVAQKAAWGLVLAGAFLMPFAARWAAGLAWLPEQAMLVVPLHPSATSATVLEKSGTGPESATWSAVPTSSRDNPPAMALEPGRMTPTPGSSQADRFPAPTISDSPMAGANTGRPASPAKPYVLPLSEVAWLLYGAVCVTLLLRLFYGLGAAIGLWQSAEPVRLEPSYMTAGLHLRCSQKVSSPVTVGSGIVLPADYDDWGTEKLRIVLAHERSHVRQGDFYLQALAGLYAAVFWFSPLGWWLKRKLSDLSEAISDRAGLEEAGSHASYARILLEFAALPRRAEIGVAMARRGRITERIERLLNENTFRQAFAGSPRRVAAVLLMVLAALFGGTALIRVEAARVTQQPLTAQGPVTGQAHPETAPDVAPELAPKTPEAPTAATDAQDPGTASPAAPPQAANAPRPAANPDSAPEADAPEPPPAADASSDSDQDGQDTTTTSSQCKGSSDSYSHSYSHSTGRHGYSYSYASNGDSYALVMGKDQRAHFSGDWHNSDIDRARSMARGDFLWFSRDGKSYVVDDPQTIARIAALYKPMEDLGRQQEALGKEQEALGRQQEELGRRQEEASIPTPNITREMAQLNAAVAKLQAKKDGTVTMEQLSDLESMIGDLQGKLGGYQGEIGSRQSELGRQQGVLGEQQGRLGAQQGRLGAEQGRLARDADAKVKSIIDQSLKDGKARPVQ